MASHYTRESVTTPHGFLEVPWDGLGRLSFGLSQFHGHGSWLVCEVALYQPDCRIRGTPQSKWHNLVACGGPLPHPKVVALNGYAQEPTMAVIG
jgi:hypothetical protein